MSSNLDQVYSTKHVFWYISHEDNMEFYIFIHSKKWNVRLPYVKHALNVHYKTFVKRMDRAPYV